MLTQSLPSQHRHAVAHAADRLGATASLLCAVHCAALPLLLALLPAVGLGFLADHRFEHWFIACASVLAVASILSAFRRHRVLRALAFLVPGLVLLWLGGFVVETEVSKLGHVLLVVCGGSCVALAHIVNLRLVNAYERATSCDTADRAIV